MNERAKQLALQALKHPDNDNDGLTVFDNDELEKFAELIVGECARVIRAQNDDENDLDSWDRGFVAGLATALDAIEQHFGVES